MQFIRLAMLMDSIGRVLPALVADWMNTKSVWNININFIQKLQENVLLS